MKNFLKIFLVTLIITLSLTAVATASTNKVVKNVEVWGIEAPYSENRVLDTEGNVSPEASYRITQIAWKSPSESLSGYYEVTVTLKTDIGYIFSGDVTGTVNGEKIVGQRLINEEELSVTYVFDEDSSSSSIIHDATSTVRYRINVYSNTEKGQITPKVVRVLKGNNQTFYITPNEGYKIKEVVVDGESVGAVSEYTFKKVKENHTIRAYFEEIEVLDEEKEEVVDSENKEIKPLLNILLDIFKAFI